MEQSEAPPNTARESMNAGLMELAIEAQNIAEDQYCCHFHGKQQLPPSKVQSAPGTHDLDDGSGQNMQIVHHHGGRLSSQKRQQSGGDVLQAMKLPKRSGKPIKRKPSSGSKTQWTEDETEALLVAVESCNCLDPSWSSKTDKWDKVLQHMQDHGFCEKTTYTAQKKFQNMHWAFRNLKAWRIREKLPLFENLSPKERIARLLPGCYCPKLYARMEAFFELSGLDDGINLVKDQNHTRRRKSARNVCSKSDEVDDDGDYDDDEEGGDDKDATYRPRGASLSAIRRILSHQLAFGWRATTLDTSKGKPVSVQSRKRHIRTGCMRGLLLREGMDLEKVFEEENVYTDDVCDAECCASQKDIDNLQTEGAKQAAGYLRGFESSTNITNADCKDCNKLSDHNEVTIHARDDEGDGELKRDEPHADEHIINLCSKGCTKKQLKHAVRNAAALDNAVNSQWAGKTRKVQGAPSCGEQLDGQSLINDGMGNDHVILQQVATNNKQLSDCIRGVIMNIQTVKFMMDKCQE
ncbi:hypothetical protein L7F22_027574 [Adiantum nelumboides]|nr:hypothetical protein [Adiantum nelumboides]